MSLNLSDVVTTYESLLYTLPDTGIMTPAPQSNSTSGKKAVFAHEIHDDNILEAISNHWEVKPSPPFTEEKASGVMGLILSPYYLWLSFLRAFVVEDPRDVTVVHTSLLCFVAPLSSYCMFAFGVTWWQFLIHAFILLTCIRRFVLALHVSSHKSIYYRGFMQNFNVVLPVILGIE